MKPYFPAYTQFASVTDSHDPYFIIDHPVKGTSVKIKLSDFAPKLLDAMVTELGGTANQILRTNSDGDIILSDYPLAFGTAAGTDTYTVTLSPAITSLVTGVPFLVKFTNANTGASTLNPNGTGAVSLVKRTSTALSRADIIADKYYLAIYDGTNIQLNVEEDNEPYGAATGTDTYAVTVTPPILTLETGNPFYVKFANTNTGASTLNVNGLGAKDIRKSASTALAASDIVVDKIYRCIYDGTNIQIDIPTGYAPSYGAAAGTDTYTVTLSPAITVYTTGTPIYFSVANTNTGAATLNANGLGAKALVKGAGTALAANDLEVGKIYQGVYDGTEIQVSELPASPASEWTTTTVNISSAEILGMGTTPKVLLAAPGAGKYYEFDSIRVEYTHVTTAYTLATYTVISCGTELGLFSQFIQNAGDSFVNVRPIGLLQLDVVENYAYSTGVGVNAALQFGTYTNADPTLGDGTMRAIIRYKVHTFGA